jgi:hypothetical protein
MKTKLIRLMVALSVLALPALMQAQFTFTTNNGAITITGYNTAAGLNVVIPAMTNGYPVTSIGNDAFGGDTSITNVTIPNSVTSIGDYAFYNCYSLTSVTIPNSVTNIGGNAFSGCSNLIGVYFQGNAPSLGIQASFGNNNTTVYYLPGTTGWGDFSTISGLPVVLWNPQAHALSFTGGQLGFNLTGPSNAVIVVEACTNLSHPVWLPVSTNTLSGLGTSVFTDTQAGGYPIRFYRFRSP